MRTIRCLKNPVRLCLLFEKAKQTLLNRRIIVMDMSVGQKVAGRGRSVT